MGKMSFTELQEEIYTEELKKIEKESNDYYSEYLSLKHKEDSYIDWYITVSNECMDDVQKNSLNKYKLIKMLDNLSVENVENGEFKNLLKLHQKVKNTLQKKIEAIEHYENMIDLNILQLTRRITSQNSMLKNIYGSTKKAMSDFEHSDKDYLFLDTNIGYLIIMRNFINLREWERSGVLITNLKNYTITNETDTGGVAEECYRLYRENPDCEKRIYTIISPNDICKKLDPVPFHKVYLLHAQTQFESYGRTKSFLIIGMMM